MKNITNTASLIFDHATMDDGTVKALNLLHTNFRWFRWNIHRFQILKCI